MSKKLLIKNLGIFGYGAASKDFLNNIETENVLVSSKTRKDIVNWVKEEELLGSNVDIVYVATPLNTHYEICKKILNNGKSVIVEKPACLTSAEYEELINLAKNKNLFICENDKVYGSDLIKKITELKKTYGEIIYMHLPYVRKSARPLDQVYSKEKMLDSSYEIGVYPISLALQLMGPNVQNNYFSFKHDGVDKFTTYLLSDGKMQASVPVSRSSFGLLDEGYIVFENGVVKLITTNDNYPQMKIYNQDFNYDIQGDGSRFGFSQNIASIIKEIRNKDVDAISERNDITLRKLKIIEQIYK